MPAPRSMRWPMPALIRRHRWHRNRRRDAHDSRSLSPPHPKWVDGTAVGGCSFMIHVRRAAAAIAAAIAAGLCETVLITHGESGRSGVGRTRNVRLADQPRRPVRAALWADGAADFVHDPGAALHEDRWPDAEQLRWSRSCSASGRRRTRAPPSRRQRLLRLAGPFGDYL